ncbi:glycoside hydrolase family 88 protein [Paenibacillus oryzisoli]|uniref:glycoside hydrolase family 88 protein n=1 Tax=Paenibacillus oryzisoli TaxID=1850517 RepID=UPI003D2BAEB0
MQTSRVKDEGIRQPERFSDKLIYNKAFFEHAMEHVLYKIDENLKAFNGRFPAAASKNLVYPVIDNMDWTNGFWTGMLWLAYEITGDAKYASAAESQLPGYQERIERKLNVDHHDMGFLYSLSCIAAYKLTGNETAKQTAIMAAEHLTTRFVKVAGMIQAWGDLNVASHQQGRMIIDCNMNLGLLYWASEVTGDPKYYEIAKQHVEQAARYIVRDDASTYHTYYFDVETGNPLFGKTGQGFSDSSCWARGQAWGIYGFPISYRYTKDQSLLDLNKKLIHYFLNRLPEDLVCHWDLIFTSGAEEKDSSAAAIAVCGMIDTAAQLPLTDGMRRLYEVAAIGILGSLVEGYTTKDTPESNGILLHGVYSKPINDGVDECCIWGDYFYLEALVRLLRNWKPYW